MEAASPKKEIVISEEVESAQKEFVQEAPLASVEEPNPEPTTQTAPQKEEMTAEN